MRCGRWAICQSEIGAAIVTYTMLLNVLLVEETNASVNMLTE